MCGRSIYVSPNRVLTCDGDSCPLATTAMVVVGVGSDQGAGTSVAAVVGGGSPTGDLVVSRLFLFVIATRQRWVFEFESCWSLKVSRWHCHIAARRFCLYSAAHGVFNIQGR
jgi:hypothetical protein